MKATKEQFLDVLFNPNIKVKEERIDADLGFIRTLYNEKGETLAEHVISYFTGESKYEVYNERIHE